MAAVAAAAVLALVEPHMTSPGGDMFALYYDASSRTVKGVNGSGRSAKGLSYDRLVADLEAASLLKPNQPGVPGVPASHVHSVTVPGAVAGWVDTVEVYGNGKLTLAEILKPAIELARNGAPVPEVSAGLWQAGVSKLIAMEKAGGNPAGNNAFLLPKTEVDGSTSLRGPIPGESYVNEDLARVYERIAEHGKDGFYKGETADLIIESIRARGGLLTHEDLASHESTLLDSGAPISTTWRDAAGSGRDLRVHEIPPNGQGIVALQTLAILQALQTTGRLERPLHEYEHNSAEYLHLVIEALKSSFRDVGNRVVADLSVPSNKDIHDPEHYISEDYIKSQLDSDTSDIHFDASKASVNGVSYFGPKSDTVYMTATDQWGNACSFINSVYGLFGSGIVPRGTGFVLQNRGGNFNLIKGSANGYEPGKRPYHTIIPAMVTIDDDKNSTDHAGDLYMTYGVMGAFMQPQGHVQVLLNLTLFGFNEQEALDAPRICLMDKSASSSASPNSEPSTGGSPGGPTTTYSTVVGIERGMPESAIIGLQALGHEIVILESEQRSMFGRGQIVRRNARPGTLYAGASDPRGDGAALPQVF